MADEHQSRSSHSTWERVRLIRGDGAGDGASFQGWSCTKCRFVLGGPTVERAPSRCPMCTLAAGHVLALVPDDGARVTLVALDARFRQLLESFRTAKRAHEREVDADAESDAAGHYDLDTPGYVLFGEDACEAAIAEQRSALALAEAVSERTPQRTSMFSMPPPRPSHP